ELPGRLAEEIGGVGRVDEGVDLGVEAVEVLAGERDVGRVDGGDVAPPRRRELDCLLWRGRARPPPPRRPAAGAPPAGRRGFTCCPEPLASHTRHVALPRPRRESLPPTLEPRGDSEGRAAQGKKITLFLSGG